RPISEHSLTVLDVGRDIALEAGVVIRDRLDRVDESEGLGEMRGPDTDIAAGLNHHVTALGIASSSVGVGKLLMDDLPAPVVVCGPEEAVSLDHFHTSATHPELIS